MRMTAMSPSSGAIRSSTYRPRVEALVIAAEEAWSGA